MPDQRGADEVTTEQGVLLATLYLPLNMNTVGQVLRAISDEHPDAVLDSESTGSVVHIRKPA